MRVRFVIVIVYSYYSNRREIESCSPLFFFLSLILLINLVSELLNTPGHYVCVVVVVILFIKIYFIVRRMIPQIL